MYREDGEAVWSCELNSYGKVRNFQGEFKTECPFRFQGQYHDNETGLYYNRFRYYSPEEGMYINQDPIGILGGLELYAYVHDPNSWIDEFGLASCPSKNKKKKKEQVGSYTITFASGKKYHGKGPKSRMEKSASGKAAKHNDPVVSKDWTKSKNDTQAFKDEYKRMQTDATP